MKMRTEGIVSVKGEVQALLHAATPIAIAPHHQDSATQIIYGLFISFLLLYS